MSQYGIDPQSINVIEAVNVNEIDNDSITAPPTASERLRGIFESKTVENGYFDLPHLDDYEGTGKGYGYGYGYDGSFKKRFHHSTSAGNLYQDEFHNAAPDNSYSTFKSSSDGYNAPSVEGKLIGPSKFVAITDFPSRLTFKRPDMIFAYILEWITAFALFGLGLVMYSAPYPDRWFRLSDASLSYPALPSILPDWSIFVINIACPLALVAIIWLAVVRNGHDLHHAVLGLAASLSFAFFFSTFLWVVVGGLRPDFLERCNPNMNIVNSLKTQRTKAYSSDVYFRQSEICQSYFNNVWSFGTYSPAFPSATASSAMAGWFFAMLYIGGKTNTWRLSLGHFWKFLPFVFFPMCSMLAVSLTRIRDNSNSWYDVCMGWVIGLVTSLVSYRLHYCSIFGMSCYIPNYYLWRHVNKYILEKLSTRQMEKIIIKN
ncbi:PA-phosphatase related-family protein [Acrasis kona]|uniref:PA-phosphatase related-family protein n=1 Tax=Acrasis kona TaxID=1008807 RepID=A0AAW2YKK4_9EUKA